MLSRTCLSAIAFYQQCLRVALPPCCRFFPSCSEYAKQAIEKYGVVVGAAKAVRRLCKCHPFSSHSGYDPLE
ncbi:MAG TPA: membrane protein insertion efficiency factor YidD [Patescibacteria group bacterium]|nr:membrane protein insertion efficiency factor YidD [Patescibacteria group bacterium]